MPNFGHLIINGSSYRAVELTPFMPNKFKMTFEFLLWLFSRFLFFAATIWLMFSILTWNIFSFGLHTYFMTYFDYRMPWNNWNNIQYMSYNINRIDGNVIIFHRNRFGSSDDLIFRRHLLLRFDWVLNFKLDIELNHFLRYNLIRYVVLDIHQCHYIRFIYRFFQSIWKVIRSHFQFTRDTKFLWNRQDKNEKASNASGQSN